jgi:hypothetical protein
MIKYNNPYTQKIYDIIVPLLGDLMTQNIIKLQSKKIGKNEENLLPKDLPQLAEAIKSGLVIFLGSEAAKNISTKILAIK